MRSTLAAISTLAATCALLAHSRTARAQYIDLPGTQPHDLDSAAPLDSARSCGTTCHFSGDPTMPSVMPYDAYIGSMKGNTMRDPLFLAALTVAEQDRPQVGDFCLRCHTPPGFVGGRTRSSATAPLGTDLNAEDMEGVSCDSCHRQQPNTNLGNAQYVFDPSETRFGPYDTIDSIRHPGAASPWFDDARLCGTCHEIRNPTQPLLRADGSDTGQRFPLDSTYSEWASSDFAVEGSPDARTCQDCHMPDSAGQAYVATNTTAMLRDHPARHDFSGANAWALRVLEDMRVDVASGDFYDPTLAPYYENGARRAEDSLRSAVSLAIRSAPASATPGASIQIVARITNLSGHRLPTGYADGRRVWLAVDLVGSDGTLTPVSGTYDEDAAHLDTSDPQLRVYEAVQGRFGSATEGHLALYDTIVRDTRIPPQGYHPPPGLEPVGADYSGGPGGSLRNWDDAHYTITIPSGESGTVMVRVRARYQTTTREYVEFLAGENHTDMRGSDLLARYQASGRDAPFDMATATATIAIVSPSDAGSDAADASADASRDASGADIVVPSRPTVSGTGCSCRTAGEARGVRTAWVVLVGAIAMMLRRRRRTC